MSQYRAQRLSLASLPLASTTPGQFLTLTVYAIPAIWAVGLSPFAFHVAALVLALKLLKDLSFTSVTRRAPMHFGILSLFVIAYSISLTLASGTATMDRWIASAYNLSIWCMGIVVGVAACSARRSTNLVYLRTAFKWLAALIVLLSGIAVVVWWIGITSIEAASPIEILFPVLANYELLHDGAHLTVLRPDFLFNRRWARTSILAPYPNAAAAVIVVVFASYLQLRPPRHGTGRLGSLAIVLLGVGALIMTWSRSAMVAGGLATLVSWLVVSRRKALPVLILALVTVGGVIAAIVLAESALELRAGGTVTRFASYAEAVDFAVDEGPLFGIGVKPRVDDNPIPVGSHSTYLGVALRTGVVGTAIFLVWQATMVIQVIRRLGFLSRVGSKRTAFYAGIPQIFILMWMAFEDLDAPASAAFLIFMANGLLFSPALEEWVRGHRRQRPVQSIAPTSAAPLAPT